MIRAHFGIEKQPFAPEDMKLLPHQQEVFETLRVHCQQGGLCIIVGEPGTGKSIIKHALCRHDPKRHITPVVNRTLHTYHSTLRILCEVFQIDTDGRDHRCESRLIVEAQRLNHLGKMLAPIIDDAHPPTTRHRFAAAPSAPPRRLPKNHDLVLVAQPELPQKMSLSANEDIKSRVTYSVVVAKLAPDDMTAFIPAELDRIALAHATFTAEALSLIVRASERILRRAKNLCVASLLEAVRDRIKTVDLKQVNRVLLQPHWRRDLDVTG